jgi:4-hydroxybenzoate polyprenyltransferase
VAAVAAVAGGAPADALRLGAAMTLLQFGIGATNDLVDAPRDAGHKPGKPSPAGLIRRELAAAIALGSFIGGIGLAVPSGPATVGLGVLVIGVGLLYDLALKGTPWSWLPFAVGIPILPVFGWLGASGSLPAVFALLVPVAVAGGAALAIANALVDIERDRAAGAESIATALGSRRAWAVQAGLVVAIVVAAVITSVVAGRHPLGELPSRSILVAVVGLVPLAGVVAGRSGGPDRRERAWQVEAVGLAAVAVAWVWVTAV